MLIATSLKSSINFFLETDIPHIQIINMFELKSNLESSKIIYFGANLTYGKIFNITMSYSENLHSPTLSHPASILMEGMRFLSLWEGGMGLKKKIEKHISTPLLSYGLQLHLGP